eukprot:184051-Prymnesium_polylepis.1
MASSQHGRGTPSSHNEQSGPVPGGCPPVLGPSPRAGNGSRMSGGDCECQPLPRYKSSVEAGTPAKEEEAAFEQTRGMRRAAATCAVRRALCAARRAPCAVRHAPCTVDKIISPSRHSLWWKMNSDSANC